uniref:Transcription initiation factor TFIID subunit 5 n=1 Tax=Melanaphis sacchari TaxID=742174 RepID=A0A2H8TRP9_9HEMI
MYFALAETPGGRPTTVTTAAISDESPRTSAVPAPSVFLPHAEPSTSRGFGGSTGSTAAPSSGPDADGRNSPGLEHDADGPRCTLEDYDMSSSEDEYSKSGSTFSVAVGHYVFQRNLIEDSFISAQESKAVIEYVNLKFVENNFRSLGLDQIFDKNNIMQAEQEFKSFEIWFSRVREYAVDREFIRDLRLPLFCHLYLNLYAPRNHTRLQAFLKTFEYLFTSPRGVIYLQELKNVTNVLDLSPRLAYFRRNKFVYGVSPIFISNLYDFFYPHFMLKVVFQEWFDINYTAYEDPRIIFDDYYANNLVRVNNLDKANTPKQNNNVFATKPVLCKKTLNSSQNKNNNRKLNNFENDVSNDGKKSRNHRKKHKSRGKNKSSTDNDILLQESSNEISNDEQQLRKKIKSNDGRKSISDEDSRLFEKSSEVSDNEAKMNKRQKKNSRKKFTSDESLSEVSNNKEKKFKRQKKSDKSKSSSDNNMDISNDGEEKQKQQNKRSKSKFTSDDDNRMSEISSDEKNLQKPQKKQKLRENKNVDNTDDINLSGGSPEISNDDESSNNGRNNRGRNEHTDNDNSSLYESSFKDSSEEAPEDSSGDSSEDFSSTDSSYDEEIVMHKFVQHEKKSAQHLRYETSRRLKHTNTTKIDFKNLDEDWFLRTTHQIILKNCSKLSCSILTSDLKFVAAGSLDSLIYLWERRQQFLEEKNPDILHSIGNINPSNFASSVPGNNLMEYLDKSTAFVLRGHGGPIFDLAELPSAKILLSASNDKTYRAWDMVSKRCLEVYNEHEHRTWCIAACPYSLQVATGSCEGASCLWFLNYKRPLRIFMGHLDDILVLKFHPNQVLLATGSSDKTVRVFELTTGECHRLLMGHSDYITCLEFNAQNSNHLASASGCGEIIIWDVPSSEMVWKIKVGNKLFSDLVWLTKDILLASLTSGVVLKCDTKLNYVDSSCKVKGFETTFDRLISLQMINNTVYTIGIPDKSGGLRPIPKRSKEKTLQMKNEQKSRRESSPLSKLFFPQHIIDNDGNSMKPLHGLISTASKHPPFNYEYQLNTNNQFKKSTSPSFLNMNLRSAPFNLSADEISKLSSEYQSENIRLVPATDITNNLQNAYLLPVQQNVRTTNQNSINIHSTNDQLPSTSKSQKSNKTPGPSKSKITTAKQQNFGKSNLTMHTSIQHMQIKTTTIQEQLHIDDQRETNTLVQQYVQTTSTSTHKQQTSNLLQFTRPGMSSQLPQNSIGQQEQQQHSVGSSISVGGTNVQQQQLLQQMRSNINLTQGNVQQRLSPQTNNRSPNINVTQRPSPRQSPNQSSSDETSTGKHTRMQ